MEISIDKPAAVDCTLNHGLWWNNNLDSLQYGYNEYDLQYWVRVGLHTERILWGYYLYT